MVIRHGEKPKGGAPYGVTAAGEQDSHSLTTRGWARAGALVNLFAPHDTALLRAGITRPVKVFAAGSKHGATASHREQETVSLVAEQLGTGVDTRYSQGDEHKLAKALEALTVPVLVCWEHHHIPKIAAALGATAPSVPAKWPGHRFDVVWVFTRTGTSGTWTFTQIPELLLPGDSTAPIS